MTPNLPSAMMSFINPKIMDTQRRFIVHALSLLSTLGIFYALCMLIDRGYPSDDVQSLIDKAQHLFVLHEYLSFKPEPAERLCYLSSLFLLPALFYVSYKSFDYFLKKFVPENLSKLAYPFFSACVVLLIFAAVLKNLHAEAPYFVQSIGASHAAAFLALGGLVYYFNTTNQRPWISKNIVSCLTALSFIAVMAVCATVIFDLGNPGAPDTADSHFGTVFPPAAHVFLGEGLLVNTFGQYGLYAHFLEPFFRIAGMSVFTFTLAMAFLMALSFFLLGNFLQGALENKAAAFAGLISLIFYDYLIFHWHPKDPYFQYVPIRTFFPVLFVFSAWQYFKRAAPRPLYFLNGVIFSLAVLWNPETGIVCLIAWCAALIYHEFLNRDFRKALRAACFHLATNAVLFAGTLAVFSLAAKFRYGAWPDLIRIFDISRLFFVYGYYMSPMPASGAWQIVVLIYIFGLAYALRALILRENTLKARIVFSLSILGAGVFSYFQGNSGPGQLSLSSYPATLLLAVAADELASAVKNNSPGKIRNLVLLAGLLFILAYPFGALASGSYAGELTGYLKTRTYPAFFKNTRPDSSFARRHTFVRECLSRYGRPGDRIIFLLPDDTLHYLELNMKRPWNGPTVHATFLRRDIDEFQKFAVNCENCHVFIDIGYPWMPPYIQGFREPGVTQYYEIAEQDKTLGLVYLKRKAQPDGSYVVFHTYAP